MAKQNKTAADEESAALKQKEAAEKKAAEDKATAEKEAADKEAADKEAAENEAAEKGSNPSDVTNANENPEFSKLKKGEATDTRVSQLGESEQVGASKQTPDADTAAREQQLAEREKALDEREAKIAKGETGKVEKKAKPVSATFEGNKYQFVEHAPAKINVDGKQLTQEEIAKDEEVLLLLIGGQSSLLKKL